jgi:hypothetical protein
VHWTFLSIERTLRNYFHCYSTSFHLVPVTIQAFILSWNQFPVDRNIVLIIKHLFTFRILNVRHPEVFNTYINIQWCISQTQQNFIMFIIVLEQHVSILIESLFSNV